jgi:hypothetical protein
MFSRLNINLICSILILLIFASTSAYGVTCGYFRMFFVTRIHIKIKFIFFDLFSIKRKYAAIIRIIGVAKVNKTH